MFQGGYTADELVELARRAPDEDARWEAVSALHADGSQRAFELGLACCLSDRADERVLGADVLGQLGTPLMPFRSESAAVLRQLLSDPHAPVARAAAVALGHLREPGALDDLVALRVHPDPEVRHAVAFALMAQEDRRAIEALVELTRDPSALVRDWATFALGSQVDADDPIVREALVARLADPDEAIRVEAMVGLAGRRDPRAIRPIAERLVSEDVAHTLVDAARAMASPDLVPALRMLEQRGWARSDVDRQLLREAVVACSGAAGRA